MALVFGAISAAPAWAHDTLLDSTPEAEEVLDENPDEVVLEFSGSGLTTGDSMPNTIWVTDDQGEHWEGETEVDGATMSTELPEPLPDGDYEVLYNVVYSDGHSEELSFTFEVDAGASEEAGDDAAEEAADADQTPEEEQAGEDQAATEGPVDAEDEGMPAWGWALIGGGLIVLIVVIALLAKGKGVKRQDAQS